MTPFHLFTFYDSAWDNLTSDCHLDVQSLSPSLSVSSLPTSSVHPPTQGNTQGMERPVGGQTGVQTEGVSLTEHQTRVLNGLHEDHSVDRHLCVLGSKGSGKSVIARAFALRNDLHTNMFPLYAELTARGE